MIHVWIQMFSVLIVIDVDVIFRLMAKLLLFCY